jgi:concentrative nucleoside transporter, CNT family
VHFWELIMERAISALGILVFLGISYALSVNRSAIRWRTVAWGLGLEFTFALLILKTPGGLTIFKTLGDVVSNFLAFSDVGAKFVFGENFKDHLFAFQVLPTIIFFSAFISVLYYYGILQRVVNGLAWIMMKTMKTSGSESLSCAGNIFLGPTESALIVKPYVAKMTQSELHAVMTGGFATIAGGVLGAYLSFGIPAEHLIAAFFMTAPTSLVVSKLLYPETEVSETAVHAKLDVETNYINVIDAITTGAIDGVKLAVNVGVMIIAFLGLLAAFNALLGWLGGLVSLPQLSLQWILSFIMAPVAWLMGVPWADCLQVGALLGTKTILNEFIAFLDLKTLIASGKISQRAIIIATYALCNFANIGSIGITIGGIAGMAPNRQHDLARMGVKSMIGGLLAGFITACIASMLV